MQLPKRADQHIIESISFRIFSNILPDDWIIRDVTERDYGVDCYIEICNDGFVTGQLISVQLKGSENIETHNKGEYVTYYNIKPSTFNYWSNLPVPVIFILINICDQNVYFSNVKSYIRTKYLEFKNERLTSIKIPINNRIKKESSGIILQVIYLIENDRIIFEHILSNYVTSITNTIELLSSHYCRDCFLPLDEEEDHEMRFLNLYKDTKYLAERFNIQWTIKSLKEIIDEGQNMFGNTYLFYEKQIAEFVVSINPIIKEIINKITNRITVVESDFWSNNNYPLWKYLSRHDFQERIKELDKF